MPPEPGPTVEARSRWSVPVPGTRVRLGAGLLVVLVAVAAGTAWHAGRDNAYGLATTDVIAGAMAGAGLVLSVLVHEAAHAAAAWALGYQVDWVLLGLLGGQTAYSGRADRPLDRAAIAMAGPAASAAAVVVLLATRAWAAPADGPVAAPVIAVLWFNAWMFVTNLVPVPGSDGWYVIAGLIADAQREAR